MYYLNQQIEEEDGVYFSHLDGEHYIECDKLEDIKRMVFAYNLSESIDFMHEHCMSSEDEIEHEWNNIEYIHNQHDLYDEYRDSN